MTPDTASMTDKWLSRYFLVSPLLSKCVAIVLLGLSGVAANAQNIALSGMLGNKPLLVVNGSVPKAVAVGETYMGVKVLGANADSATLLSGGQRFTLRLGNTPVNVGAVFTSAGEQDDGRSDNRRIVLSQTGGGHFFTNGAINGKTVQFMVDTGATSVAIGVNDADRLGLNYKNNSRYPVQTANGVSMAWRVKLDSVRIKGVQIHSVDAVITPSSIGVVLLGNSFLNRFIMTRNGDQMILERRY